MGKFIVVEGPNLAGKTTFIQKVVEYIARCNPSQQVVTTREPGGTTLGESLRHTFKSCPMHPYTQALLVNALRQQHVAETISPALNAGKFVISDRYYASTVVYQLGSGKLSAEQEDIIHTIHSRFIQPDLQIFLVPTLDLLLKRKLERDGGIDQYEGNMAGELCKYLQYFEKLRSKDRNVELLIPNGNNYDIVNAQMRNAIDVILDKD